MLVVDPQELIRRGLREMLLEIAPDADASFGRLPDRAAQLLDGRPVCLIIVRSDAGTPMIAGFDDPTDLPGSQSGRDDRSMLSPYGATLTAREEDVLRLLANGLTNGQIAKRLTLSPNSVKRLVCTILTKLGCANRASAAAYAVRAGLLGER